MKSIRAFGLFLLVVLGMSQVAFAIDFSECEYLNLSTMLKTSKSRLLFGKLEVNRKSGSCVSPNIPCNNICTAAIACKASNGKSYAGSHSCKSIMNDAAHKYVCPANALTCANDEDFDTQETISYRKGGTTVHGLSEVKEEAGSSE